MAFEGPPLAARTLRFTRSTTRRFVRSAFASARWCFLLSFSRMRAALFGTVSVAIRGRVLAALRARFAFGSCA